MKALHREKDVYKMVNAKSEYFIAQSIRQYWLLESVASFYFSFILSLARSFIAFAYPKKHTPTRWRISMDYHRQWMSERTSWVDQKEANEESENNHNNKNGSLHHSTIAVVVVVIVIISSIVVCLFWAQRPFYWIFSHFFLSPQLGFYFSLTLCSTLFSPVHGQPHSYNKCLCLQNAELHKIKGNLFLMHDGVYSLFFFNFIF